MPAPHVRRADPRTYNRRVTLKEARMRTHRIAVIPGDGIGKEVVPEGVRVGPCESGETQNRKGDAGVLGALVE